MCQIVVTGEQVNGAKAFFKEIHMGPGKIINCPRRLGHSGQGKGNYEVKEKVIRLIHKCGRVYLS